MAIKDGVVEILILEKKAQVTEVKTKYQFRKDRKWHWLQRICFRVLDRLQCFATKEQLTIERHFVGNNGEKFIAQLLKSHKNIVRDFPFTPTRLLIGTEQYAEIMHEELSNNYFNFTARYKINPDPTFIGLKVEVVPWMTGFVILP